MIVHIVLFKLIRTDIDIVDSFIKELLKLKVLSYYIEFEVVTKTSIIKTDLDGDVILFSLFENEEKLQSYMTDQKHLQIINRTSKFIDKKYVLDYSRI
ncbi:Dabb family protein [uncultured Aquimarina sp.]|uniref:Dabb family protein n=1 Tax=uncultured Aquimarina sp. TaxID=575652 RepID=UPI00261E24DD|nr:Dabb family protein [uncultured Aquimarina sp.]